MEKNPQKTTHPDISKPFVLKSTVLYPEQHFPCAALPAFANKSQCINNREKSALLGGGPHTSVMAQKERKFRKVVQSFPAIFKEAAILLVIPIPPKEEAVPRGKKLPYAKKK